MGLLYLATAALGLAALLLAGRNRTKVTNRFLAPLFVRMDENPYCSCLMQYGALLAVMAYARISNRKGPMLDVCKHTLRLVMPPFAWYALHSLGPAELSAKLLEASGGKEVTLAHVHWGNITYIGR